MLRNRISWIMFTFAIGTNQATADKVLVELLKHTRPAVVLVETFDRQNKLLGRGSGFFINHQGHVITSHHVIAKAHSVSVKTMDGKRYSATSLLAGNARNDIAKLLVDTGNDKITLLTLSAIPPEIGEDIFVIGNPSGLESTVSKGIASAYREVPGQGAVIQITAPISPGSSGGPVINTSGHVVGVVTATKVAGQSLNFAMPSKTILALQDFAKPMKFSEYVEKQQRDIKQAAKANVENSLKGLKGVGIIVSDLIPPELTKRLLHQVVDKSLKEHRIKVYSYQELMKTPGKPHLFVEVNYIKDKASDRYIVNCHVTLRQDVVLVRDRNLKVDTIDTWSSGGLAIIKPEQVSSAITAKVKQCVGEFVEGY